jgi:signal transduction histidine kinase/HAMP domain-containing protein
MPELVILLKYPPSLQGPVGLLGWAGWLTFLGLIGVLLRNWRDLNQNLDHWRRRVLVALIVLVPITSLIIPAIELEPSAKQPLPWLPLEPIGTLLTVFAPIPWFLAAGFIGPAPAAALGAFSGLLLALWGSHNAYLPLELASLAAVFGWMVQQKYRTPFFRLLRRPFLASLLFIVISPALLLVNSLIVSEGNLVDRIEYGFTHLRMEFIAFGVSIAIAGLICEGAARLYPKKWGAQQAVEPSPAESKLIARFLYILTPLTGLLLFVLVVGGWYLSSQVALTMLRGRMETAGNTSISSIPSFITTGHKLISDLVKENRYYEMSLPEIQDTLARDILKVPFFNSLIYLDVQGEVIASQPEDTLGEFPLTEDELWELRNAIRMPVQYFAVKPVPGAKAATISFMAQVVDQANAIRGVLIGRSSLYENLYTRSMIEGLNSLRDIQGEGILIDDRRQILYHPDSDRIMTQYTGSLGIQNKLFNERSPDGNRKWVYYTPALGKDWGVVFTVPAQYVQEQSVVIAGPLLIMITILTLIAVIVIRFSLKTVTASLQRLAVEADRMARGELDRPLKVAGEDEVGQLGWAFEQMRASLKSRLDELNRILRVSQGVASTLELDESLTPVLESALINGATASRIVLVQSIIPNLESDQFVPRKFGYGPAAESYTYLDDQVLELAQRREVVKLTSLTRPRIFTLPAGAQLPQAILAVALRHKNTFFGALWNAYDQPHRFTEEEIRYLTTLAGQAALAAGNARLFLTAEIGRLRLEAILTSTPDPVLVTDQNDNLLLTNPAARQVLNLGVIPSIGKPVDEMVQNADLVRLLKITSPDQNTVEITFPGGSVYLATASTLVSDGSRVGRVCILRDVTTFKKLDAMKSEFVSTVSHDLRAPLTLIQGFANMLPMVGELNDQQLNYLRKINQETEKITRLVNNVLNLGRIESGIGLQFVKRSVLETLEGVVNSLKAQAAQKRIQLIVEPVQPGMPEIEADQDLLHQALLNLVDNAIKFTSADGKVTLAARLDQDKVIFSIQDTGIGISPTDQRRLFEKFYRPSQKGVKFDGGSGLGLAIVKSIVDRHGGQVWVDSTLGKGSTFYFSIPLHPATTSI